MSNKNKKPAQSQGKATKEAVPVRTVCDNRKARHEYEIIEVHQAGIELVGTEVKSMRQGKANLQDSFAKIEAGELWLYNCHVSPYDHGNRFNHDPVRRRKLLMHAKEVRKLKASMQEKGLTLIPLKIYFKRNWIKVDLALARGKKLHDKRDAISARDNKRQLDRLVKQSNK